MIGINQTPRTPPTNHKLLSLLPTGVWKWGPQGGVELKTIYNPRSQAKGEFSSFKTLELVAVQNSDPLARK